jgi:DNA-binding transcriptional ArsR family regulator
MLSLYLYISENATGIVRDYGSHLTGKPSLAYCAPMSDVFEALAAPARRAILDELCARDGQTLFEICSRLAMKHDLAMTRQAISQHLDVLELAGLIKTKRQGRCKYHYLDKTPLEEIVERWLKKSRKADNI